MRKLIVGFCAVLVMTLTASAGSLEKAMLYQENGLATEAKKELIDIVFSAPDAKSKAEAYYRLGSIAFAEKNVSAALSAWTQLVQKFPTSDQAATVKDRIAQLAEIVGDVSKLTTDNAVAMSYLEHASFWSKGMDEIFHIDSSWISQVDAAVKWYDKVITEFPKTPAARAAYEGKIRVLIGWKEEGRYSESQGLQANFGKYIDPLLQTMAAFESDFPDAPTLQAFRYQIAQEYWRVKNWAKTREWLQTVISKAGPADSFYRDLAERRLKKVEY